MARRETEYEEFEDVTCERTTAKAILVSKGDLSHWIPMSVIGPESEVMAEGDTGTLIVARWFVEKEGIEL